MVNGSYTAIVANIFVITKNFTEFVFFKLCVESKNIKLVSLFSDTLYTLSYSVLYFLRNRCKRHY